MILKPDVEAWYKRTFPGVKFIPDDKLIRVLYQGQTFHIYNGHSIDKAVVEMLTEAAK